MDINETNNGMADAATHAMQQKLEQNRLKQLQLNEAMHKTKDALTKLESEIEALKKSIDQL